MAHTFMFDESQTDNINFKQLLYLRVNYWNALKRYPFPEPPSTGNTIEMIHYFKRMKPNSDQRIGPYTHITVLEAANRIASDLVIINGVVQLLNTNFELKELNITVRLSNRHVKGKGDFTIGDYEGEAFNVASSFYKQKMRHTYKKWNGNDRLKYVLVNDDVFDFVNKTDDIKIVSVKDWDVPYFNE